MKRFNVKLKAPITSSVCGTLDLQDTFTAPLLTDVCKHAHKGHLQISQSKRPYLKLKIEAFPDKFCYLCFMTIFLPYDWA
jgi:hypothetical protein